MGNQASTASSSNVITVTRRKSSYNGVVGGGGGTDKSLESRSDIRVESELMKSHSMHEFESRMNSSSGSQQLQRDSSSRALSANSENGGGSGVKNSSSTRRRPSVIAAKSVGGIGVASEDKYLNGSRSSTPNSGIASTSILRRPSVGGGSSFARQRSLRRNELTGHPISALSREIIQGCFENAHNDLGMRICSRLFEKRSDYQHFILQMGKDKFHLQAQSLKEFLDNAVAKIDCIEVVEGMARKYGEEHVHLKTYGFKPDFWVSLADALTVEAVILDQATHQPTDTIIAWSLFVSILFSNIRDGYYSALRAHRISTRKKSFRGQRSSDTQLAGGSNGEEATTTSQADAAEGERTAKGEGMDALTKTPSPQQLESPQPGLYPWGLPPRQLSIGLPSETEPPVATGMAVIVRKISANGSPQILDPSKLSAEGVVDATLTEVAH